MVLVVHEQCIFMALQLPGTFKGILDSGATSSMVGLGMAEIRQPKVYNIMGQGRMKLVSGPPVRFSFGNHEKTESLSDAWIPGYVDGKECDLPVSIVHRCSLSWIV